MRDILFYGRLAFIVIAILAYGAAQLGFFDSETRDGAPSSARLILLDGGR